MVDRHYHYDGPTQDLWDFVVKTILILLGVAFLLASGCIW